MATRAFDTKLETIGQVLAGPWRAPVNMLLEQSYDNHVSLHDDAMAQKLGFKAGPIEGPTHYSQFVPLAEAIWGERFLTEGCLSAHYRNMVMEGEEVRAFIEREPGEDHATIWASKKDGTEVLRGTASVGSNAPPTALDLRLNELAPLQQPVILRDLKVGRRTARTRIRMDADQHMGDLYPFSLNQKLAKITEPSPWYSGADNPWGRPIIPWEMVSVLVQYVARGGSDRAHQADIAAAIDSAPAARGDGLAKLLGKLDVAGVRSRGGTTIDRDGRNSGHSSSRFSSAP